ncbi:hypothetical protein ACIPY3_02680 [Paenarthrobacter sp. NPDC089714]|uniref:hypothetical protein n=1 Tax=Paenarthrobacter sp. NPDC089714 TaxID=3364377 RepID=UPI00380E5A6B
MADVIGTLWDAGLGHLSGKSPVLYFTLNAPNAKAGGLYTTEPVKVVPAADGSFTAPLASNTDMQDESWYTLRVRWVNSSDPKTYSESDYPDWQLEVPTTGGAFSNLFGRPPRNRRMVYVSLTPPEKPLKHTLWLKQDPTDPNNPLNTGELYEWRNV